MLLKSKISAYCRRRFAMLLSWHRVAPQSACIIRQLSYPHVGPPPEATKSNLVRGHDFAVPTSRGRATKFIQPAALSCFVLAPLLSRAQTPPAAPAQPASPAQATNAAQPAATPAIENLRQLSPRLYSGGEPQGDVAFSKLAELGVRTVVSVDGARPDVEAAHKHGIRYIHIPIGYDAVDANARAALTRVVRDVNGPVFLHCHHGKHRGPAAAAILCLAAGDMTRDAALEFMKTVGTGAEYEGLWRDVREFMPLPADAPLPELVEVAEVDSLAAAMAVLDRAWDGVKVVQAAGWKTPTDHADLAPAHQALLVWEGLRESRRTLDGTDETLAEYMDEAIAHAAAVRDALEDNQPDAATAAYKLLEASCAKCHTAYRN
jgi:protein tyrosine phosphatase (PTP) superfamily phosphohydrolase (DUF442 family)